jgi:hypothetical protein
MLYMDTVDIYFTTSVRKILIVMGNNSSTDNTNYRGMKTSSVYHTNTTLIVIIDQYYI